ncbi:MAG TPA: ATP-binding protein [Anaerolineae bacterium]|nr:ATP-binding protein [Anaerolineae bacterium]
MLFFHFKKLLSVVAFLLFGSIAVVLWQNQNSHRHELILRHTETSAQQIRIRAEELINTSMASLELLAERWVERRPPDFSQKRFLQFADAFYNHFPGFTGINLIDPEGIIQWVFPEKENAVLKGRVVYSGYRNAFEKAGQNHEYSLTPCIELYQGGIGFEAFLPLIYDGRIQGYLNGVFQVKKIMDLCLAKNIFNDFWIRLHEDGQLIYTNLEQRGISSKDKRPRVLQEIHFSGKMWQLELEPKAADYKSLGIRNLPLLIFGIVISAVLSFLLYRLLRRIEMYREAIDNAVYEVSQRNLVEDELRENEKRLKELLAEIAAKNKELGTFVYMVSHDLKTPIVTIEGFIGAMREDFGDQISEGQEEYLRYMSDAALKMDSLINDLLELSRIGRMTEQKSRFSFADVVEKVLNPLRPRIKASGIEVNIQGDIPNIYGEKKRFMQVVENLLVNAVKYIGKENPGPRIDVGVYGHEGQNVFFVRDNGIGIEEMYFEKIFQVFQRLPSAKKAGEGTGIGLAIVKRIVEHHGGSVWVTSTPGEGSTFFFTINDKES